MWGFLNTLTAPVRSTANQFLRNQIAGGIRRSGLPVLRTARDASKSNLTRGLAAGQIVLNQPAVQVGSAGIGAVTAVDVSNQTGFTRQLEDNINKVGPALNNFFAGITPEPIQQFGREQEKKGWGGALEMATPFGFLVAPFIPNTQPASVATIPPKRPIANLPANYKKTELAAGAAAEAFRPGAGFPSQQPVLTPVVPPVETVIVPKIDASLPPAGNIGALTGVALYKAAREAGYDNTSQLGLSQWAKYHQGRLPEATAELAAVVELEEAKAREFLDNYLNQNLP